jgi:hypothetical protein
MLEMSLLGARARSGSLLRLAVQLLEIPMHAFLYRGQPILAGIFVVFSTRS